jgi:ribonuclease HI
MAKNKFYVVWSGRTSGIYNSWEACSAQVSGFENASYKSFKTMEEAEKAFAEKPEKHIYAKVSKESETLFLDEKPIIPSISVDAAWNHISKVMEYRGVYTDSKKVIFSKGPFPDATNNVGEFLALVHALALLKKSGKKVPIYSDSKTAIKWVKTGKANTKLEPTENNQTLFDLIQRAEKWLKDNKVDVPVLKWETKFWGEVPADYGRK